MFCFSWIIARISVSGFVSMIVYQVRLMLASPTPVSLSNVILPTVGQVWPVMINGDKNQGLSPRLCFPANPVYLIHHRKSKCHLVAALHLHIDQEKKENMRIWYICICIGIKVSRWNTVFLEEFIFIVTVKLPEKISRKFLQMENIQLFSQGNFRFELL